MVKLEKEFDPLLFAINYIAEDNKRAAIISKARETNKHNPNGPEAVSIGIPDPSNDNSKVSLGTGVKKKGLVIKGNRAAKAGQTETAKSAEDESSEITEEPELFKKKDKTDEKETESQQGTEEETTDEEETTEESGESEPGDREEQEGEPKEGEEEAEEGQMPEGENDSFNAADSLHEFLAKNAIDPNNLTDELVKMMLSLIAFDAGFDDYDVEAAFQSFKSMPVGGDPSVDQPDPDLNAAQVTLAKFLEAVGGDVQRATALLAEYVSKFGTEALNESAGEQVPPPTPQQSEEVEELEKYYLSEAGFGSEKKQRIKKKEQGLPGKCVDCGKQCDTLGNDLCCLCTSVEPDERCGECAERAMSIDNPDTY